MSEVIRQSGVTVVELGSSYDALDEEALRVFGETLVREAEQADPPKLVVDMSNTTYVASSFLETLVRAWKRIKQRGGAMALCGVHDLCVEILEITHLSSLWPIYSTRDQAIDALK
jgi:anti-anti-sigma factor